ncbi:MAG: iron chaperone [Acidimicrobiaceae bacterium]
MTRRVPPTTAAIYKAAPQPHRDTMLAMREHILSVVPHAEEVISYGMPAFRLNGTVVAGIMAAKNHVGYYPFSGSVLHLFQKEMSKYSHTKSAIHVPVDKPLSRAFIKKLINAKINLVTE